MGSESGGEVLLGPACRGTPGPSCQGRQLSSGGSRAVGGAPEVTPASLLGYFARGQRRLVQTSIFCSLEIKDWHCFPCGQHRRRRQEESSRVPSSGRPTCVGAGHGPKQHHVRAAAGYCPRRLASAAPCSEQLIMSDSSMKATPLGSNSWSESTAIAQSS